MAIVVCSSLILDHGYSFPLLSLQSFISYVLHSIFTHISYHYYSLFALWIPDMKRVFQKESVRWKKKKNRAFSVLSLWLFWVIISLLYRYSWHCGHCLVCRSILLTYPMLFILGEFSHSISFSNLYIQHPMLLIAYFIFLTYLMPFDNRVLSTSKAIYTGGVSSQYVPFKYPQWVLPHWVSYSQHLMLLSDIGVQVICLSQQSDPLNSLPHSAFWLPGTIYAGVLSRSMSLAMKDSFWSSIMSNNLPQSAAWLFPNSPSQLIIQLFCPLSTVGLSSLGFLFMKDSFWSFIIVQTIFLSRQPDCFQILSTLQCHLYWGVSSQYILVKYPQ